MTAMTHLRDLVQGRWKAQALAATLRLGLPELLAEGPRYPDDLARALGASAQRLVRLLRLLECLGLVEREGGGYALSPAGRCLLDDHPLTVARDARWTLSHSQLQAWTGLEQAVRTGAAPPVAEGVLRPADRAARDA